MIHGRLAPTVFHYRRHVAVRYHGISCVPYARQVSGIEVSGDAWQWWNNAAGAYARGNRPEVGSVLNFRSNPRMPLGHVAVVDRVVNSREVVVEHANWGSFGGNGRISHGVTVVDVSEANNWSAVRVEVGQGGDFGSVYPTYGFIYNRPDTGVIVANVDRPAPQPDINPVPSDLRPRAEQPWQMVEEVAEAPVAMRRNPAVNLPPISTTRWHPAAAAPAGHAKHATRIAAENTRRR
jgi:surface antigen